MGVEIALSMDWHEHSGHVILGSKQNKWFVRQNTV